MVVGLKLNIRCKPELHIRIEEMQSVFKNLPSLKGSRCCYFTVFKLFFQRSKHCLLHAHVTRTICSSTGVRSLFERKRGSNVFNKFSNLAHFDALTSLTEHTDMQRVTTNRKAECS